MTVQGISGLRYDVTRKNFNNEKGQAIVVCTVQFLINFQ